MARQDMYHNRLQIDYFSESYQAFEEAYYRYSTFTTPLTFLVDDILKYMAISGNSFFTLDAKNSKDNKNHHFHFIKTFPQQDSNIQLYHYHHHDSD